MQDNVSRIFYFDGDVCEVKFYYDESCGKYFGDYPDFEESPRYTAGGRPWTSAMQDGCEHGENKYCRHTDCSDCGSCKFFLQERPGDLIGICDHESKRRSQPDDTPMPIPV